MREKLRPLSWINFICEYFFFCWWRKRKKRQWQSMNRFHWNILWASKQNDFAETNHQYLCIAFRRLVTTRNKWNMRAINSEPLPAFVQLQAKNGPIHSECHFISKQTRWKRKKKNSPYAARKKVGRERKWGSRKVEEKIVKSGELKSIKRYNE